MQTRYVLLATAAIAVTYITAEWLHKTRHHVEMKNIIDTFQEISLTSCIVRCRSSGKCKSVGMDKDIVLGQTASCFLIGGDSRRYAGKDVGDIIELFFMEIMSPQHPIRQEESTSHSTIPDLPIVYTLLNETTIRQGQKLTTLHNFGKQYAVSFQLKPTEFYWQWRSVIHFTQGRDSTNYGDRVPAVFVKRKANSVSLQICSAINAEVLHCQQPPQRFTRGEWISINIVQFKRHGVYLYENFLNNKMIYNTTNKDPQVFENVKVYAGNPWTGTQTGVIRNVIVKGSM